MTTAAVATRHPLPAEAAQPPSVRPGALTELLAELARAPEAAAGWEVPLLPGDVVGRFEIVREIGRGGFGVVYEAQDRELARSVAFKAVRASAVDPLREARTLGEAEAAARLAHPNIVHLYDVGRCEQGAYLIMELLRGETLDERLARGKLPLREALRIAVEVSRGLAHAHAQGVVHRDLKPGNVFVCEDGQVKVLDFGLAQVFGRAGVVGGTPAYMAPEQERGEVGDERSDVYSLGVMLHELVAGERPPPRGESGWPPPLPGAPSALARLAARMLADDPALRPRSGQDVHAALATLQKSLEPRRRLWTAWALTAAAVAAAGASVLWPRHLLPPGRLLVAMADTANATGDPDLDGAGNLLGAALEQSKRFSLLARSRLLASLRQSLGAAPARIDEALARDAARRAQANALIIPAVRAAGGAFEIELRAVDLFRDEPLFTLRERAGGKGNVSDALDRLSERVRREFREDREDAPEGRVPLSRIAPANPEAWRHYTDAKQLDSAGDHARADEAYQRALAADPDFPLVHAALAARSVWLDDATAQRHFEAAARHADRLPPKERTLLNATRAKLAGRIDEAIEHWDRAIAGWPQDPAPYSDAGFTLLQLYSDAAAAGPYLEKALALAALDHGDAIQALVAVGRMDEALERARRWTENVPGPDSFGLLGQVHRIRGESAPALEAARRVVSFDYLPGQGCLSDRRAPGSFWSFVEADALGEIEELYRARSERSWEVEALRGRLRAAIAGLDDQVQREASRHGERSVADRSYYHNLRGNLLWGLGDADRVWREVEEQLRLGSAAAMCSSQLLASLGDLDRAARLMSLWSGMWDPRMYCPRLYKHVRDWKQGDREGAAQGLAGMHGPEPAYHLGVILGELGRDREAVETFRRFRRDPVWNYDGANLVAYPRSLYLEAVSLERLGERGEAARAIERLLALWRAADADLPYLREARALRARLAPARASP